jgi:hypothetical protein
MTYSTISTILFYSSCRRLRIFRIYYFITRDSFPAAARARAAFILLSEMGWEQRCSGDAVISAAATAAEGRSQVPSVSLLHSHRFYFSSVCLLCNHVYYLTRCHWISFGTQSGQRRSDSELKLGDCNSHRYLRYA